MSNPDQLKQGILAHAYSRAMQTLVFVLESIGAPKDALDALKNGDHEPVCSWAQQMGALNAQRDELLAAVKVFCEGAVWAAREWKEQEHIKPLFDLAAKAERSQQ